MVEESESTKSLIQWILRDTNAQPVARHLAGAALGALKILRDEAGLETAIEYCQLYLKELHDERPAH